MSVSSVCKQFYVCALTDVSVIGYVYLVFECEKSVRALLQACTQDLLHPEGYSEYYFKMSSRRMRCKDVSITFSTFAIVLTYSFL